ncbi:DUF1080 domain-containing protein [Duganella sp. FT92W]|uniref:galactosylceramidase n=1 Tax=Pseudoduganella rivuli TaxID=2666085 RepID=A0A7X2IHV5_9BURK|nr:family 16 glycoside hydrolase [Pseudoduganella rivuli]MRV70311.1 DUF1080 domain-containing protein [Pseudoduganella rivuli]
MFTLPRSFSATVLAAALSAVFSIPPSFAQGADVQRVVLNGNAGGKRFDGIGVVDGGGGTSVLLKDYPQAQRRQILDLLYKPKFGASVSALYVEVPGDGNATQGSMPSHAHARGDLNYSRGYTWWLMREARQRNPALTLDGAAWSAPGWLGDKGGLFAGTEYSDNPHFFSQDTVDYYVSWLQGLRDVHGLRMEALGMRNEKGVNYAFAKALRGALDSNGFQDVKLHGFDNWPNDWKLRFVDDMMTDPALRDALGVIGAHINAPEYAVPAAIREKAAKMGKPLWNTEGHVYKAGYDGLISIVQAFNENYIRSGVTKVVNWYGIAGLYTMESYSGEKEAAVRANWPWSGHYVINPSLWGYAHYGQFTEAGWTYISGGSGDLAGGGTYVTLKSPRSDYSIIIETKGAKAPQRVRFENAGGLSGKKLAVWRSTAQQQFMRQADLAPDGGAVMLTLEPDAVYSLTTTEGQRKGSFDAVPALSAFPFPYYETFEQYQQPKQWGYLPHYFADIAGAFELADCPGVSSRCLHQSAPVPTISWAPDWHQYTIIGDDQWQDYEISADVYLNPGDMAGVMGRINHVGTGYGIIPKGYFLQIDDSGQARLVVVRGKADKKALVGDAEQQALIRQQNDAGEGGEKVLASARLPGISAGQWLKLKLRFNGSAITAYVNGKPVFEAADALYARGMAGLLAGALTDTVPKKLSMPYFDNVLVNRPGGALPAPAERGPAPLY